MMETKQTKSQTKTLFLDYLSVCNAAIAENKDKFPYDKIIAKGSELFADKSVGVAIYKDEPESPHDFYTLRMSDGAFYVVDHGKKDPDVVWKASQAYLEKVVDNKSDYVAHPAKLDLDWLKSRIGIA